MHLWTVNKFTLATLLFIMVDSEKFQANEIILKRSTVLQYVERKR